MVFSPAGTLVSCLMCLLSISVSSADIVRHFRHHSLVPGMHEIIVTFDLTWFAGQSGYTRYALSHKHSTN